MSDKHLNLEPTMMYHPTVNGGADESWWYEEAKGIVVVVHGKMARIPWRQIRAALKRKDRMP